MGWPTAQPGNRPLLVGTRVCSATQDTRRLIERDAPHLSPQRQLLDLPAIRCWIADSRLGHTGSVALPRQRSPQQSTEQRVLHHSGQALATSLLENASFNKLWRPGTFGVSKTLVTARQLIPFRRACLFSSLFAPCESASGQRGANVQTNWTKYGVNR